MRCFFCLAILCVVGWPITSSAQTNTLFGGSGQGGFGTTSSFGSGGLSGGRSSGVAGTGQTGSLFGNTGFGSSSTNNLSSRMGNSSSGSAFGSGMSGSGMSGGLGGQSSMFGTTGMSTSNSPFIGRNNVNGQIGNRLAGQQGAMGAMQALQGLQGLQRGGGFNNNRASSSDRERLPIRPTQRIGFDYRGSTSASAIERVSSQFSGISERRPELADVTFAADDEGNVILRGSVESEEAAELAAALVRLEPGVRGVVNELTIDDGSTP